VTWFDDLLAKKAGADPSGPGDPTDPTMASPTATPATTITKDAIGLSDDSDYPDLFLPSLSSSASTEPIAHPEPPAPAKPGIADGTKLMMPMTPQQSAEALKQAKGKYFDSPDLDEAHDLSDAAVEAKLGYHGWKATPGATETAFGKTYTPAGAVDEGNPLGESPGISGVDDSSYLPPSFTGDLARDAAATESIAQARDPLGAGKLLPPILVNRDKIATETQAKNDDAAEVQTQLQAWDSALAQHTRALTGKYQGDPTLLSQKLQDLRSRVRAGKNNVLESHGSHGKPEAEAKPNPWAGLLTQGTALPSLPAS